MVWSAFGFVGKISVLFLYDRNNGLSYQDLFENSFLYFTEAISGPFWVFQQGIHSSTMQIALGNGTIASCLFWITNQWKTCGVYLL